tara:strand:- start:334 stop:483 length:150 start_codon:yes stop_codon:yes gene_type:complete
MSNENSISVSCEDGSIYLDVGMSTGHLTEGEARELISELNSAINSVKNK